MTFCLIEPLRPATVDDVRCAATTPQGKRCHFAAEDGQTHCRKHRHLSQDKRFAYATAAPLPKVPKTALLDLTAEVDLLKRLIAARADMLTDADSVIIYSGHIADLITRLQKLMDGAIRLEQAKGNLISRQLAMGLIGNIMNIVADVVDDTAKLDIIHERIEQLITEMETPK